jgi:hypothetical protein
MALLHTAKGRLVTPSLMETQFAMDDSISGVCRNCGHKARNHYAASSPIMKRCLEKDCKCDWAWNGKNDTTATEDRKLKRRPP